MTSLSLIKIRTTNMYTNNSDVEEKSSSAMVFWYYYYLNHLRREGLITEKEYEQLLETVVTPAEIQQSIQRDENESKREKSTDISENPSSEKSDEKDGAARRNDL